MGRRLSYEGEGMLDSSQKPKGKTSYGCSRQFSNSSIIRHVHCETQHYLTVLSTHTSHPFSTSARTITLDLERPSQPTLWLCTLREKTVPKSLHL